MDNREFENVENESSMDIFIDDINKSMKKLRQGDIIDGTVVSVSENYVIVNINYMRDGIIEKDDFGKTDCESLKDAVNVGDTIKVYITDLNDGEGNVKLSKKLADELYAWEEVRKSYENGSEVEVRVLEVIKGGFRANYKNLRGFIPYSQMSFTPIKDGSEFVNKDLLVKIIELDEEKNKLVFSRKEYEAKEREANKERIWNTLEKGMILKGTVRKIVKFGAFVDLGGIDGLVHLNDLSWERVNDPSEIVEVNQEVEVYVIGFDKSKNRISLGLKDASKDPWISSIKNYKVGDITQGKVVKVLNFGAIVNIGSGLEGLVHQNEIKEERVNKVTDELNIGDNVKVKIIDINENDRKISLSIKDASDDRTTEYKESNNDMNTTIGDILGDKLKNFKFD